MAKAKAKTQEKPTLLQPTPRPITAEEQAVAQVRQQRARAEVAVLKQRFAETDVAKTIAEAERDQLIQQSQLLQQRITALETEIETLKNPKDKEAKPDTEPESKES